MKRLMMAFAASAALAAAIPAAANAQTWTPINQRQANLDQRIDQGVRNGDLTRAEAQQLRAEFRQIANLETQYRASRPGLTAAERADLDRRMDYLSARIMAERNDRQDRNNTWQSINARQAALDQRIDMGVRNGALTRAEAVRLRADFRQIANLEARYRASRPGLTAAERADLDRRMDLLSARIRVERNDRQDRGAWQSINQRQARLDARIDAATRAGQLSLGEAVRLRLEFQQIAVLENTYRNSGGGLNAAERADLDRRFDALSARIRDYRR